MKWRKNKRVLLTVGGVALSAALALVLGYSRWIRPQPNPVLDLLGQLPPEPTSVFYLDLGPLRESPFLAALYKWAPASELDADYAQFVQSTGFNYERDLDQVGVGLYGSGSQTTFFAIAEGRFDKKRIAAYALQTGTRSTRNRQETFSIPKNGGTRRILFTFLRPDRIAITNGSALDSAPPQPAPSSEGQAWREHFLRLAGSPMFAAIRQGVGSSSAFSSPPTTEFQAPDLSALLNQLQWITLAGKPDGDHLRVVLEGEGSPQLNTLQMSDLINGMLVFAEAGLNDSKLRARLQPQVREAYLDLFKSIDVSRIDRGDSKSVRLIFEITPNFLDAVRPPAPGEPPSLLPKADPDKGKVRN